MSRGDVVMIEIGGCKCMLGWTGQSRSHILAIGFSDDLFLVQGWMSLRALASIPASVLI